MNKTGTHSLPNLFTNTKEACRDFYALTTNEYNDEMYHSKFEYKSKINEILNKIVIKNNFEPVVVNLGPLKGKWIPELYEIFKPKKLICVDLIDNFFEDLKKINPSIECFLTSGNELCCLETNTVDYIFSIDALTRIQEKDLISYLKDFKRVLKPGGKIFVHFSATNIKSHEHIFRTDVVSNFFVGINFMNSCFVAFINFERMFEFCIFNTFF